MGAIMAIGVAVANAILLVTFAEQARRHGGSPLQTAIDAARARMRPVLMTSAAMIAGMIPMALALGEGAEATAPLGRAVIGGLAAATLATLIVLPSVYSLVQQSARVASPSLDPDDPESAYRAQGARMRTRQRSHGVRVRRSACARAGAGRACGGNAPRQTREGRAAPGPPTIDVVRVVEQPLERDAVAARRADAVPDGRDLSAESPAS